jgi:hypothetical protein
MKFFNVEFLKICMRNIFLLSLSLLFLGCDGEVFKKIEDKSKIGVKIDKIEVIASDSFSYKASESFLKEQGFLVDKSDYKLRVEHRDYAKTCNNPLSKTSSDYNYDGLVAITLFYKDEKVYTSFRDFRGDVNDGLFRNLIDGMIDDLEIKK